MTATTTGETTWSDEMPAMALARAVPVVDPDSRERGVVTLVLRGRLERGGEGCGVSWHGAPESDAECFDSWLLRVDLDDPQGFAYALRMAVREAHAFLLGEFQEQGRTPTSAKAHLHGLALGLVAPTDADRFVIATALAEVR